MKINGTTIQTPKTLSIDIEDIDGEAYRSANGTLIRDRIATKRKLNCEWPALTTTQISTILSLIASDSFTVQYLDPVTGTNITKPFYAGTKSAPVYRLLAGRELWEGLTVNFIEI